MTNLLHFKEVSLEQWDIHWRRVPKSNLLQSWQYGAAKEQVTSWRALRFLILDSKGYTVALSQILTCGIPFLGGVARINRGPLLLDEIPEDQYIARYIELLQALLREVRRRHWWVIQIAPELPNTENASTGLMKIGFQRCPYPAWASGRLELGVDEKTLLMGLDGKWRNCLRKGERLGVLVSHHNGRGPEQDTLISDYAKLQQSKCFKGLPEALLRSLATQKGNGWQFHQFVARAGGMPASDNPIGMLVTVQHGDSVTYLIGSTNDLGRKMQANSVLLWRAILQAKEAGCTWFDIGGLNSATPKGVAEFKKGINAVPYALIGEWRWYYMPWCKSR